MPGKLTGKIPKSGNAPQFCFRGDPAFPGESATESSDPPFDQQGPDHARRVEGPDQ
jgi:hypothetical protein